MGNSGIMPELSAWLGSETGKRALTDKERRKAREERTLAHPKGKAKAAPRGGGEG